MPPLLSIENLSVSFKTESGMVNILDRVNLIIEQSSIFGLVGESGCGKTVTSLSILNLLPRPGARITGGSIKLRGKELVGLENKELRAIRGKEISMIFQEPSAALNPLMNIRRQILELFDFHTGINNPLKLTNDLLARVGFSDPERILSCYPHQLSGGMLQRVMIALALLLRPALIIADEPTTALDVTIQAQIMELLVELQREYGTSILLITHNLALIAQYAHRIAVMYAGRIAEESDVNRFIKAPLHPYSKGLLDALPDINNPSRLLQPIDGQVPQPADYVNGCRFRNRCKHAFGPCESEPPLFSVNQEQKVACFLHTSKGPTT